MPSKRRTPKHPGPKLVVSKRVALMRCHRIQGNLRIFSYILALSIQVFEHLTSCRVVLRRTMITSVRGVDDSLNLIYFSKCIVKNYNKQ